MFYNFLTHLIHYKKYYSFFFTFFFFLTLVMGFQVADARKFPMIQKRVKKNLEEGRGFRLK